MTNLPGICIVCRQPVVWSGRHWRNQPRGAKHVCPTERDTCGQWMPKAKDRCARRPGHLTECRSPYAMANQYRAHTGRERAA